MQQPREECGHEYLQHSELGFWYNLKGKPVQIFPPVHTHSSWILIFPSSRGSLILMGPDGENRAFSIAADYIAQS
jgi:hypothetical protein